MRVSSRCMPKDGRDPSGYNRCASSRSKRVIGISPVVPWIRAFTPRSHLARCASKLVSCALRSRSSSQSPRRTRLALRPRPIRRTGA